MNPEAPAEGPSSIFHLPSSTPFDESFLRKLERLALVARAARAGRMKGERRSTKRGTSVEFADYRNYTHGDDLRQIDWNIYARLEKLFLKLFEEEEDVAVHVLVDASRSMDWGEPSKLDYARRTAAALSYIALAGLDRVALAALDGGVGAFQPFLRGKGQVFRVFGFLGRQVQVSAPGVTDLNRALRAYARRGGQAGLVYLISDLLSPAGCEDGLTALGAAGHQVSVIHILAPDEVEPTLGGDLRLVDVETGQKRELTIDEGMLRVYHERLEEWLDYLRRFCLGRGINYLQVDTSVPFEELILHYLRSSGMAR